MTRLSTGQCHIPPEGLPDAQADEDYDSPLIRPQGLIAQRRDISSPRVNSRLGSGQFRAEGRT